MTPLALNPKNGYLESQSLCSWETFTGEKKIKLLDLARQALSKELHPSKQALCDAVNIGLRTLERHLKLDQKFAAQWQEIRLRVDAVFTNDLAIKAKAPNGTLACLAILRHNETGSWTNEYRPNGLAHEDGIKAVLNRFSDAIDAEIVG